MRAPALLAYIALGSAALVLAASPLGRAQGAAKLGVAKQGASQKPVLSAERAAVAQQASLVRKPVVEPLKKCKPGELSLRARCKSGVCPAFCIAKPGKGPGGLCPEGLHWAELPCPAGARCLVGGRCVAGPVAGVGSSAALKGGKPAPSAVKPSTAKPAATKPGAAKPASKPLVTKPGVLKPGAVKCSVGRVPTKVQCLRAPCPTLCLPVHLDPGLRASPGVRPL